MARGMLNGIAARIPARTRERSWIRATAAMINHAMPMFIQRSIYSLR